MKDRCSTSSDGCPRAADTLDGSLVFLLRRIGREYMLRLRRFGLPPHVLATLLEIYTHPELAEPSYLADVFVGIPRQTMTFILDFLEKREIVRRVSHESDRRKKFVRLTAAGKRLAKNIHADICKFEEIAQQQIPEHELPIVRANVIRYVRSMIQQNSDSPPASDSRTGTARKPRARKTPTRKGIGI